MNALADRAGSKLLGGNYLRAVLAGAPALEMLAAHDRWSVEAVFGSCVYLSAEDSMVCVGSRKIGAGPLNVVCEPGPVSGWLGLGLARGQMCLSRGGALSMPGLSVTGLDSCRVWSPPAIPADISLPDLAVRLDAFAGLDATDLGRDGLAPLIPWIAGGCKGGGVPGAGLLATSAAPSVRETHFWLVRALGMRTEGASTVQDPPAGAASLLGLGPGLTPSGDDFLAGALLALRYAGRDAVALALGEWLLPKAVERTNPISLAHLRQAAKAGASQALHRATLGLLLGGGDLRQTVLAPVLDYGHTSGLDALAGAVMVARALADVSGQRAPQCPAKERAA